jgi:hypothetical protein
MVVLSNINKRKQMAQEWLKKYFVMKPEVTKIFDDLDAYHNFCRFELLAFNQADLYNKGSPIWNQYLQSTRPRKWRNDRNDRNGSNHNNGYKKNYR